MCDPYFAALVLLHLPASGKLQLFVGEHVQERHQVPVVLVALKVVSIAPNLTDHMLQTCVGGEHTVGTLRDRQQGADKQDGRGRKGSVEKNQHSHQRKESIVE